MGKVIKGSAGSEERYTLAVPSFPAPVGAVAEPDEAQFAEDAYDEEPDAEPAFDLDALAATAQQLVDDATRDAQALVDAAQARADELLADAGRRALALADDARRAAHDEGHAAGLSAAEESMGQMLETLAALVSSARDERHALFTNAESELVKLAVGIAERVLHQQITLDNGVVVEMAKAAIARLVDREKITIRVNPADVERMREHREALLALGDVRTMRVIEDQRVDRGGVILETDGGSIDAKISTQLSEARKILHVVDDVAPGVPSAAPPAAATSPAAEDERESLAAARAS